MNLGSIRFIIGGLSIIYVGQLCNGKLVRNYVPDSTKEPNFKYNTMFRYEKNTHLVFTKILNQIQKECFAYNTTLQERKEVHSEVGQRLVEAKILFLISEKRGGSLPLMSQSQIKSLPSGFHTFCHQYPWYRLNF